jgi:hypothetical protein
VKTSATARPSAATKSRFFAPLSRNSTHYSFPLSSLGRACLSRPRPATNPSPGPRRLKKAASRSTLSPWERADPLCHALRF